MSKRFYLCIIFCVLSFLLQAKTRVVCTTTIIFDITKNIAGNKADVICILPIGSDPHIYEPIPSDATKIANADILLKNGLYLEGWLEKLITNTIDKSKVFSVSEGVIAIQNSGMHASPDPHAWMNPLNGKIYAQNIANFLAKVDSLNADWYQNQADNYIKKLDSLDVYVRNKINQIPENQRILITSHDAFRYFGIEYGIKVESAMGTSTDAEVMIEDMNRIVNTIKKTGVNAIFVESTINPKFIEQIAHDQGVIVGGSLFADSIGDTLSKAPTYIQMIKSNTDTIFDGLVGKNNSKANEYPIFPLISAALFLFIWAFLWLYFKIKNNKHSVLDWSDYKIEIENLSISYEKKTVLSNINFVLESGKLYGLLGPNGAGKSTLFKSILGLINPDSGKVIINGKSINEIRNKIAYIPQKEEIDWAFPATVFDIVLTGRLPEKKRFESYSNTDKNKTMDAIRKMGLEEFAKRQIGDLSGGQQQRVFIARALCQEAELLFFDEPFVGVDTTTEAKIMAIIKKLVEEKKTVIMIHHDLSKVKDYFDNIIMINQHLVACGKTNEVFTNQNISKTYSGRLAILQETDKYMF